MAAPSYTTDLTIFDDALDNTNWVELSGAAVGGGPSDEPDLAIYGSDCISEQVRKTGLFSLAYNNGAGVTIPTDGGFFVWAKYFAPNSVEVRATRGLMIFIGSAAGTWGSFNVDGSDTYPYGGWVNYFVDPTLTPDNQSGTYNTTYQYCGHGGNSINAVSKGNPHSVDIIRYGRGESRFTLGDLANGYATFDGYALVNDNATTGRFGLFQDQGGSYLWKGLMSLGLTATVVDFRDSNVNITIDDTIKSSASFNRIEVHNSGSRVDWTAVNITKVGTVSLGEFEMIDAADVNMLRCNFSGMSTFDFLSSGSALGCFWISCEEVTPEGADLSGSSILTPNVVANSAGLIWNVNTDPNGLLDDMTFSKTSGTAHHAITFGLLIPTTSITLTNCDFGTDFSAGVGTAVGDETFHFLDTAGTITLNLVNCTGNFGYRTEGVVVTIIAAVSLTLTGIETDSEVRIINLDDVENFNKELTGSEQIPGVVTKVVIADGGSGYAVNDVLTIVGGTGTAATITVDAVNTGVVTAVSITTAGSYTVNPSSPSTTTVAPAGGTGCTLRLTIVGTFTYNYDATFNPNVAIIVFHLNFKEVRIEQNLAAVDASIPIQQNVDRTYNNP